MGKQKKKIHPEKVSKYYKECERCGNGGNTKKVMFKCRYCGWINGTESEYGVAITHGSLEY